MNKLGTIFVISILLSFSTAYAAISDGTVDSFQKISDTQGGFTGSPLISNDRFGYSAVSIGDLNNDGVEDMAVGAAWDNGLSGTIYIFFMKIDGTIDFFQRISNTEGGFGGGIAQHDFFGSGIANMGDLDGDGVIDLAVGAFSVDDGELQTGAVWILFMKTDGTVKAEQKISSTVGGFGGDLDIDDRFGQAVANIGDFDLDGVNDLAVSTGFDDDGGRDRGAVWILYLKSDGTVKDFKKISDTQGGFNGILGNNDEFGSSVANIGDLDGDGVIDLAVGAQRDTSDSGSGAVWILFMKSDGTVKDFKKISSTEVGATIEFGWSVANMGDLDGDGVTDIAVGSLRDGPNPTGSAYILFLKSDGSIKSFEKISKLEIPELEGFGNSDFFGTSVARLLDLNKDGVSDLVVGAQGDDDGGHNAGAVYVIFLNKIETPQVIGGEIISIQTTSLILASAQSFSWMIPVVLSVLGIGLFVVSRKN